MSASALIQRIGKLAIKSFSRKRSSSPHLEEDAFKQLRDLVASVSSADLHLDTSVLNDNSIPQPGEAPVRYTAIYEDADVTICVFILRNGVKMPMHDHPNMMGLLKVVHGKVAMQNYTLSDPEEGERRCMWQAVKHPRALIGEDDQATVLHPIKDNLHEISSVGGSAAFLDILAPPYGEDRRNTDVHRDCNYYEEFIAGVGSGTNSTSSSCDSPVVLRRFEPPNNFWCERLEYIGPPLQGIIDSSDED